jgi:phospholipid/cholesterol/gamma-HCH transport system substrate-binding protein
VYWLHNTGGLGARVSYQVNFNGPVPGLAVGAAVLFNGIRVGEITALALATDNPRRVEANIAVAPDTPVRRDTKVGLEFQGLTGVPVIALEGGEEVNSTQPVTTLVAEPGAGESMTQAARAALRRVDTLLAENAEALGSTISNLKLFSDGLARNTGRLDSIIAGLERMTGGGAAGASKVSYDLKAPENVPSTRKGIKAQVVLPEPSTILLYDTQRILMMPPGLDNSAFANVQWADTIPKLLHARLIQTFENQDPVHAPLPSIEGGEADYQLLIDIRAFQVVAGPTPSVEISLFARLLGKNGQTVTARLFEEKKAFNSLDAPSAVEAFNAAFAIVALNIVDWTTRAVD